MCITAHEVIHTHMYVSVRTGVLAIGNARFGQGTGQIWLDNVNCRGGESMLSDCPANPIGTHNCQHSEDAGVRCPSEY